MAPDKIYLAFDKGFVAQASNIKKDINGNSIFLPEYIPITYIRKDTLLEWAKHTINDGASCDDYGLGYQHALLELIDKLNSM